MLTEFKKAILYLKRIEKVHNNADVAAALGVSSSYLSQILHGNKPFTEAFSQKFEKQFKVKLGDPFSYTDLNWVSGSSKQKHGPENSKSLINSMKELLQLKDEEVLKLRSINKSQQELITVLQKEVDSLKYLLK